MKLWRVVWFGAGILGLSYVAVLGSYLGLWARLINLAHPPGPPPHTKPLPYGSEILQKHESDMVRRVTQEYARVKALVDEARGRGADVSNLDRLLFASVSFARQKRYDHALTLLNRIEMSVPRKGEAVTAARLDDTLPREPDIRTKSAATPELRRRKRR